MVVLCQYYEYYYYYCYYYYFLNYYYYYYYYYYKNNIAIITNSMHVYMNLFQIWRVWQLVMSVRSTNSLIISVKMKNRSGPVSSVKITHDLAIYNHCFFTYNNYLWGKNIYILSLNLIVAPFNLFSCLPFVSYFLL